MSASPESLGSRRVWISLDRQWNSLKVEGDDAIWVNGTYDILRDYLLRYRPRYAVFRRDTLIAILILGVTAALVASMVLGVAVDGLVQQCAVLVITFIIASLYVPLAQGRALDAYKLKRQRAYAPGWKFAYVVVAVLGSVASLIGLIIVLIDQG